MKRIKVLMIIGLLGVILMIINACCDEGFSYKWHNIILQSYTNGEPATENTINKNEFSLRVHLISTKSDEAGIYFPNLMNYAYAYDCMGKYLNIDAISDIDIFLLTDENGMQEQDKITFQFDAIMSENSEDKISVIDLPERINKEDSEPVEHFDLVLSELFDQSVSGKFVVTIKLADKRILSDTTETLNIVL